MNATNQISESEFQKAVEHLQQLIRINTTNPPGNEILACKYLAQIFDRENIPYKILESAPGRGNIIARLSGDGSKKPLLLTSHLDVVPCEKDKWKHDPFGGVIHEDCIWGRGAVDMKQMTAMELAVFLKAHREKAPLKRDLIFAAIADEEAGCQYGSKWLVENHPELVRAEYALNEGGGFSMAVEDKIFYPIGVAQKGLCWFKITAYGDPGHGAMPHGNQALAKIALAAHQLAQNKLPFHKTKIVEIFVSELARHHGFFKRFILKGITKKSTSDFILNRLLPTKAKDFKIMFRNITTPTMMNAGQKTNVIPAEAELTVDGRILPGQTVESFLAEVKNLIGPGFKIDVLNVEEPIEAEYGNDFFRILKESLNQNDPGCIPVPFLIPGFTDAMHYAKLGTKTYGFAPAKFPAELNFRSLYHGHNERIPTESIRFGIQVLWHVIQKSCL